MPYYLELDDRELVKRLILTNVCKECGGKLESYYDIKKHLPYLQCRANPEHEGIAKEYREPRELNIPTRREKMEQEYGKEKSTALAKLPMSGALSQPQAMHILKLVYPDAPEDDIIRTAIFCRDFGLHPLAKEVYLIPFKGKHVMVVGIPASRKMAHNLKGEFSFLDDTPRVATEKEIDKQFGKDSDEAKLNVISVTRLQGEGGNLAIGFGLWPKDDNPYGMDKGNTKRNMANIRSERQAMDRLPGKPLPQVEVIDEAYVEVPDVGKVALKTGEIKELEPPPEPESELEPELGPDVTEEDAKPVTKDEIAQLKKLCDDTGMDTKDLGKYIRDEKHWEGINSFKDLKKWQFNQLLSAFQKGRQ